MTKSINRDLFTIVVVNGAELSLDSLGECIVSTCGNMTVLSEVTGISRNRLYYVFTELKKKFLFESEYLIFRSSTFYPGKVRNARGNKNFYNRNR